MSKLYVMPLDGAVTVIVAVATLQVGCVIETTGVGTGGLMLNVVPLEIQPLVFWAVTV